MTDTPDTSTTADDRTALKVEPEAAARACSIGQWQLDGLIGEGSFTCVYRARPVNCPPDRPADYAVKVLRKQWEDDSQAVDLIRREALIGCQVSHPHLAPVLDARVERPPYHLVMPYLPGATLSAALAVCKCPAVPHSLWIARQVARALGALHARGWIHGDVKPDNILISPKGHVTLCDLGLARRIEDPGSVVDRPLVGTFHYVSPELITSALRADARSDIYSLGVTLYEMLAKRLPFQANTLEELAMSHCQEIPPDLRSLQPRLPRRVARLVGKMLAKHPLRRPQTARELARKLAAAEIETFDERFAA